MLDKDFKRNLFRTEVILIVALIIVIPLALFKPSITGFVASDLFRQNLNFTVDKSQALDITSVSGQQVYISSLSLSGEVIGPGSVAIYLSNDAGEKVLVYTNVGQAKARNNIITGAAIGAETEVEAAEGDSILLDYGKELTWPGDIGTGSPGEFVNTCVQSCYLDPNKFMSKDFELQVFVEPGTKVKITEIFYTITD
jgi:hypothetical protein